VNEIVFFKIAYLTPKHDVLVFRTKEQVR